VDTLDTPVTDQLWFCDVVQVCQRLVGELTFTPAEGWYERTRDLLHSLPASRSASQDHLKRVLLFQLCIEACRQGAVGDDLQRQMVRVWQSDVQRCRAPESLFEASMKLVAPQAWESDGATRLREVIERHFSGRLTLRTATAMVHERDARSLDRAFKKRFGQTFHRYLTLVRIDHAVRLLATTDLKIESVAREVGYRTKKELFIHLKQERGLTPGTIRAIARAPEPRRRRDCINRRATHVGYRLPPVAR
jgi:AraC-like DNA-binding protein